MACDLLPEIIKFVDLESEAFERQAMAYEDVVTQFFEYRVKTGRALRAREDEITELLINGFMEFGDECNRKRKRKRTRVIVERTMDLFNILNNTCDLTD